VSLISPARQAQNEPRRELPALVRQGGIAPRLVNDIQLLAAEGFHCDGIRFRDFILFLGTHEMLFSVLRALICS
jgi:hypothetical protein